MLFPSLPPLPLRDKSIKVQESDILNKLLEDDELFREFNKQLRKYKIEKINE